MINKIQLPEFNNRDNTRYMLSYIKEILSDNVFIKPITTPAITGKTTVDFPLLVATIITIMITQNIVLNNK